jgi:hypothetical protein
VADRLVCPGCAAGHALSERFCRDCGMPLVHADGASDGGRPLDEAGERARKIRPGYSEGPLVKVAGARHQAEAELLEAMLLEEGIPSLVRRSAGFDVPDFLAAGPRDILVPQSAEEVARELLGGGDPPEPAAAYAGPPAWVRPLAVALAVLVVALLAAAVIAA